MSAHPWLVIECSKLTEEEVVEEAKRQNFTAGCINRIKTSRICQERYFLGRPVIYLVQSAPSQLYAAKELHHGHCQISEDEIPILKAKVKLANRRSGKTTFKTRIVVITAATDKYDDDFLFVYNNPPDTILNLLDWKLVAQILDRCKKDPTRNNVCRDLGYCGEINSSRNPLFLGITHPKMFTGTMEPCNVAILVALTKIIDALIPDAPSVIYSDITRNGLFSYQINPGNRCEAARLGRTNTESAMLAFHRDTNNCTTEAYAYVVTVSRCCVLQGKPTRDACTTYGKKVSKRFMDKWYKHRSAIMCIKRLYEEFTPEILKRRDSNLFDEAKQSPDGRYACAEAYVDKMIHYSLAASSIEQLYEQYGVLRRDLVKTAGFLVNVPMSECPDHFYQIMRELKNDPTAFTQGAFYNMDGYQFSYELTKEFFRRKRHSGALAPEKSVLYQVHQRHIPAVNSLPSFEHVKKGVDAVILLIKECRTLSDVHTTRVYGYYARANEYLADSCYGAGHLISMHILGVAACLLVLPPEFVNVAEIARTTRTWQFMKWGHGYTDETCEEDMHDLLRAIAVLLDITPREAEELCCR